MTDLDALEEQARMLLEPGVYNFYAGGADDELTLTDNQAAWSEVRFRPRVLRDVHEISTSTTVLGVPIALPVLVAPVAHQRMAHPGGESAMARGAAAADTVMVVSTRSSLPLEEVAQAAPLAPHWLQVYVLRDRGWTADLVDRARESGYGALVLTVDTPRLGHHRRETLDGFRLPADFGWANAPRDIPRAERHRWEASGHLDQTTDLTFDDIGWLADRSGLPVIAKGVLRGDDARACLDAGAQAVIVSNHGGRQLDGAVATARALPDVVEAVEGRAQVLVDGGIRRGTDVVRALALGAAAVLVGRPALWALTVGGSEGVAAVLGELRAQLELAMSLCGAARVGDLTADLVIRVGGPA
ncbi:MAG: alpha-hydroxy acid oxidase [Acidimicrobiales bacterium]